MALTYIAYLVVHEGQHDACEIVFPSLPGCSIANASTHYSLVELMTLAHDVMQHNLEAMIAEGVQICKPVSTIGEYIKPEGAKVVGVLNIPLRHEALLECISAQHDKD